MDRPAQKRGETYCGVKGIAMQDAAVQESVADPGPQQGEPGLDRQRHHHGAASFVKAARDPQNGVAPPGTTPQNERVRSATFVLPVDVPFAEAKREDLTVREGAPHTSI